MISSLDVCNVIVVVWQLVFTLLRQGSFATVRVSLRDRDPYQSVGVSARLTEQLGCHIAVYGAADEGAAEEFYGSLTLLLLRLHR